MQQTIHKKYRSRLDWVGKGIYLQLSKRMKFDMTDKWYINKQESILENVRHNSLKFWDRSRSPNADQKHNPSFNLQEENLLFHGC